MKDEGCCSDTSVEAIVPVDARGQMVLPKDIREKLGISAGDKVALVSRRRNGKVCCVLLIKADTLADHMKGFLGPLLDEI